MAPVPSWLFACFWLASSFGKMSIPGCLHAWPSHHSQKCGVGSGGREGQHSLWRGPPPLGCGDVQSRRMPPEMSAVAQKLFVLFSGILVILFGFLCVTNFEESYQARSPHLPLFMYYSGNDGAVNLRNMVFNLYLNSTQIWVFLLHPPSYVLCSLRVDSFCCLPDLLTISFLLWVPSFSDHMYILKI